jgi:hypothetical protein
MACDLSTKIAAILAAYADLCALCCDPTTACEGLLPENTADMCGDGDGLVTEIQAAVVALLADEAAVDCAEMTEDEAYPNPGAPSGCLDAEYLDALLDWISHITCNDDCGYGCNCGPCYHVAWYSDAAMTTLLGEADVILDCDCSTTSLCFYYHYVAQGDSFILTPTPSNSFSQVGFGSYSLYEGCPNGSYPDYDIINYTPSSTETLVESSLGPGSIKGYYCRITDCA